MKSRITHIAHPIGQACNRLLFAAVLIMSVSTITGPSEAAELVMFRQWGCEWCEAWDEEVGDVYNKTDEARHLPVRQVDIHDSRPADLDKLKPVVFTPTFVIHENGKEVGRIIGYTGESFFWELLGEIISRGRIGHRTAAAP